MSWAVLHANFFIAHVQDHAPSLENATQTRSKLCKILTLRFTYLISTHLVTLCIPPSIFSILLSPSLPLSLSLSRSLYLLLMLYFKLSHFYLLSISLPIYLFLTMCASSGCICMEDLYNKRSDVFHPDD